MPFGFVCQRTGGIAFLGESGVDPDLQRRSYTDNLLTSLFLLLSFTSVMFASLFKIPTGKKSGGSNKSHRVRKMGRVRLRVLMARQLGYVACLPGRLTHSLMVTRSM